MRDRYTSGAIALHWLIAALLVGQLAGGFFMTDLPREQAELRFQLFQLHKSFGVTILVLTLLRIVWRLTHPAPALPAGMAPLEKALAKGTHVLFYVLLLVVPLLGWGIVSTARLDVPTMLFGVVPFPHMPFFENLADKSGYHEFFEESHELAAKLTIGLLVLHVAAALKHHFINRDDVLARMLPILRRKA